MQKLTAPNLQLVSLQHSNSDHVKGIHQLCCRPTQIDFCDASPFKQESPQPELLQLTQAVGSKEVPCSETRYEGQYQEALELCRCVVL